MMNGNLADLHRQLVERMFHLISAPRDRGLASAVISEYMSDLYALLTMHALLAALVFKHEAYNNEKELRFLQIHRGDVPAPEVKFRSRPHSLNVGNSIGEAQPQEPSKKLLSGLRLITTRLFSFLQTACVHSTGRCLSQPDQKSPTGRHEHMFQLRSS
jgi:hypothetical protein